MLQIYAVIENNFSILFKTFLTTMKMIVSIITTTSDALPKPPSLPQEEDGRVF
jgi:hypothetical protein